MLEDKKTLYRLPNEYINYLMELDDKNIKNEKRLERKWEEDRKLSYIGSKGAVQSRKVHCKKA